MAPPGAGETLTLDQTELDVMQALGWNLSLKQDVNSTSGSWETPTNWSTGSMPIEPQDAYIDGVTVSLNSNVIVNSIATSSSGILLIGNNAPTTLTAVQGTDLNSEDSSSVASGNIGDTPSTQAPRCRSVTSVTHSTMPALSASARAPAAAAPANSTSRIQSP